MQLVVLICIFIQVYLPSDLLIAEQCQMTALLLSLLSARVSGWLVQGTGRARLGSCPCGSSHWGYRKKTFFPNSKTRVFIHVSLISWSGAEGLGDMGNHPSVTKDLVLVKLKIWLLKPKLMRLAWH